jgi:hypothetical protein
MVVPGKQVRHHLLRMKRSAKRRAACLGAILIALAAPSCHTGKNDVPGQPTLGPGEATAQSISGTRLKARVITTADGLSSFVAWHDTLRNEDCSFQLAEDNVYRCLPVDMCKYGIFPAVRGPTAGPYDCNRTQCGGIALVSVEGAVTPTAFVAGTRQLTNAAQGAAFTVVQFRGEDGSIGIMHLRDVQHGLDCGFGPWAWRNPELDAAVRSNAERSVGTRAEELCWPVFVHPALAYSDAACMVPLDYVDAACNVDFAADPAGAADPTTPPVLHHLGPVTQGDWFTRGPCDKYGCAPCARGGTFDGRAMLPDTQTLSRSPAVDTETGSTRIRRRLARLAPDVSLLVASFDTAIDAECRFVPTSNGPRCVPTDNITDNYAGRIFDDSPGRGYLFEDAACVAMIGASPDTHDPPWLILQSDFGPVMEVWHRTTRTATARFFKHTLTSPCVPTDVVANGTVLERVDLGSLATGVETFL